MSLCDNCCKRDYCFDADESVVRCREFDPID